MNYQILVVTVSLILSVLNVDAQSWSQKADYPAVERHHPICFAIDNYGYLTTGVDNLGFVLDDFLRYNINTDQWETLPDFPGPPRGFGVGTQLDGVGYIGFGVLGPDGLNDLWKYDPTTENWTELASCPCEGRAHPAFVAVNGKIYVGLGNNNSSGNLDDWWEYDIASDTWMSRTNFPGIERHHPYYFAVGDSVYVGFGHGPGVYNDWYRYLPATDSWTQLGDLPDQGRVAGTHFAYGGKGYIIAGQNENHTNNNFDAEFWEYTPETDSWVQLPSVPLGDSRWAPGAFVIDSSLFFTSGEKSPNEGGLSDNDVWLYPLPSLSPGPDSLPDTLNTSIATIKDDKQLWIYPNPTQGVFTVKQNLNNADAIRVYNMHGQVVATEIGSGFSTLDLSNQPRGLYIVAVGILREKIMLE